MSARHARMGIAAVIAAGALLLAPLVPAAAEPVVVSAVDFEDGTTGTWTQSGGDAGTLTVADHPDGGKVLTVNGRSADYVGLQSPTGIFEPGETYTFSMKTRLAEGTAGSGGVRFVFKPGYSWIGATTMTADAWTTVSGDFTVPADTDPAATQVYIGTGDLSPAAPYTYLVDDIQVTREEATGPGPEPGTVVIDSDFEAGLDGWAPRDGGPGAPTVALSDVAHGGEQSAIVTDRVNQGAGIGRDVLGVLEPGATYEVSAWVRFAEGQPGDELWLSLQRDSSFQTLGQFTGITNAGWTEITATFAMGAAETTALLYLETPWEGEGVTGNTSDFLVDDIVVRVPEPAVIEDITPIKDTTDFPVGVAIDSRETSGSASDLLLRHFGQITPENHMKPEAWYDAEGNFRAHPEADALMTFAAENDLRVYGHVLVWHSQTPAWFFQNAAGEALTTSDADKQFLRDRLRTHIFDIAGYLSGEYGLFGARNPLVAFDVVNEVIADSGDFADGMRRSEWYRILGEEFVDLAFQYADEAFNETYAAPGIDRPVTLFINDYNTEQSGKQSRYHALVERLIARGVPVDGVGHQFHVNLAMPVSALEQAIVAFEDLPVTQAVTEFDVPTGTPVTEALLIDQGYYVRDAFRVFREHTDDLFHVTVWGLTDGRSWRSSSGAPLLFDDGYQAKPAYYGAVDGELPLTVRTANVFAGDVALTADAAAALEWKQLPLHPIGDAARFQLRWAPDHLSVFVSVDDADAEPGDGVAFTWGDAAVSLSRDGTGAVEAVVTERDGGYDVVAHLPASLAQGATAGFDVRVTDGDQTAGWSSEGAVGTLSFVEPLSYVEVEAAASAPVVDGAPDALWAAANAVTTAKEVQGTSGAIATVRTLWHEQTLYVLAEVADPVVDVSGSDPWVQDSVELYVDAGNAKNGSYRYDDTQIRINADNAVSFGTGDETFQRNRVQSSATRVEGGYVVEAAISLLEYGGPGTFHGLDFQVNDATDGTRTAIRNWADPTGAGYQSTARWGVGQLLPEVVVPTAPVNLTPPTIDGDPLVGERLTANPGTWDTEGLTFTYRWQTDGVDIPGANKAEYKVKKKDAGSVLTVIVTATIEGLDAATAASDPVTVPPGKAK